MSRCECDSPLTRAENPLDIRRRSEVTVLGVWIRVARGRLLPLLR